MCARASEQKRENYYYFNIQTKNTHTQRVLVLHTEKFNRKKGERALHDTRVSKLEYIHPNAW